MNIVTIGRGNVAGGLARLSKQPGHDVTALGRERPSTRTSPPSTTGPASNVCARAACTRRTRKRGRSPSSWICDVGYEPVNVGGVENTRVLKGFVPGMLAKIGQVF
jgi:hypothetical protein